MKQLVSKLEKRLCFLLLAPAMIISACSKSKQDPSQEPPSKPTAGGKTMAIATNQPAPASPVTSNAVSSLTNAAAEPTNTNATTSVAVLRQSYQSAQTVEDRFEAANRIGATGTAEAVAALEQLFRAESNKDMRVELINSLIGMSGCKDERLRFLKLGLDPAQPSEVREAAMDGLVDLEDPRSLPLLEGMYTDADPKLQTLARHLRDLAGKTAQGSN